jgi:transposase
MRRWGLAEIKWLFARWHCFRERQFNPKELLRQLVPREARMGRLVWRGEESEESPDRKVAGLCCALNRWEALWTFTRVGGMEPTNTVPERALRPAVLWREGSLGSDSEAESWFAERILTAVATCRKQGRRLLELLVAAGGACARELLPLAPPCTAGWLDADQ